MGPAPETRRFKADFPAGFVSTVLRLLALSAVLLALHAAPRHAEAVVTAFTFVDQPNGGNAVLPADRLSIPSFQIQIDTSNDVAEPFPTARFFDQAGTLRAAPTIPRNTPSPSGDIPVFEGRTQLISAAESPLTPFPPGFLGPTTFQNGTPLFFDSDTGPPDHPDITGFNVTNGRVAEAGNQGRIVFNAANRRAGDLLISLAGLVRNIPRPGFPVSPEVLATVRVDIVPVQFSSSIAPEMTPRTTQTGPGIVPFAIPIPAPTVQPGEFSIDFDFTNVPDGIYELRFSATDIRGNATPNDAGDATVITVDKDTRSPAIAITQPPVDPPNTPPFVIDGPDAAPPFQGDTFTVSGLVADERGQGTTVTLEISNRSSPTQIVSTQVSSTPTAGNSPFTAVLDLSPTGNILPQLPPPIPAPPTPSQELYRVLVRATDSAGNPGENSDSVYIVRDLAPPLTPQITVPAPGSATDVDAVVVSGFVTNVIALGNRDLEEHGEVVFTVTLVSAVDPTKVSTVVVAGVPSDSTHDSSLDNGTTGTPPGPTFTTFPTEVLGSIPNVYSFATLVNIEDFPNGRVFITVEATDQVGNKSSPASENFLRGPVGPAAALDLAQSGPDDNYDPISNFPPNRFGANDNLFFISLKSPEIEDRGRPPSPNPPNPPFNGLPDPGQRDSLRISGTAMDINTPVATVTARGAGIPTVSLSGFSPSTSVVFLFDPDNGTGIDVSGVQEGVPTLVTIEATNSSGQSGKTTSLLVFRDVQAARTPVIDFPAQQPVFTGGRSLRIEGRAEPGSLVAALTPPTTGNLVFPIPATSSNRIPRRDSQFSSIPAKAQTTVADADGRFAFESLDISTVATSVTQPTTLLFQAIDTFDNTDPVLSVTPFEVFRNDAPGDVAEIILDPGLRNIRVPLPPDPPAPRPFGLEVITIRVRYNTLLTQAPALSVTQFQAAPRRALLVDPSAASGFTTDTVTYRYDMTSIRRTFDGPVNLSLSSGLDVFGRVPNPTEVAQAWFVDSVPPDRTVSSPEAFFPPTGAQVMAITSLAVDLIDPLAGNGSTTSAGVATGTSRLRLIGPLEDSVDREVPLTAIPAFGPFELAARPTDPVTREGTYELRVNAEDAVGNARTLLSNIILDISPIPGPFVRTDPAPGSAISTFPSFNGQAAVFATIDNIQVALPPPSQAGMPVSTARLLDPSGRAIGGTPIATGERTLIIPVDPAPPTGGTRDGVYTIEVDPVDQAGNRSATVTATFIFDTVGPVVLSVFPPDLTCTRFPLQEVRAEVADDIPPPGNPFPPAFSGVDLDRSDMELLLQQAAFPNQGRPGERVREQRVLRTAPGSTVNGLIVSGLAVEILDSSGQTRSLTGDGMEDGRYAVRIEVSDRAGNRTTATSVFDLDTQPPFVTIDDLSEGSFYADTTFTVAGHAFDRGPCGFNETSQAETFVTSVIQVRLEGIDGAGRSIVTSPFFDFRPATSVRRRPGVTFPNTDLLDWSFTGRIPDVSRKARITVLARDLAGNETRESRDVQVKGSPLDPPRLLAPDDGAILNTRVITFRWEPSQQARRYDLSLTRVTPATAAVTLDFPIDFPEVTFGPFDLAAFAQAGPRGVPISQTTTFAWTMRSVDATGVNTGPLATPRTFIVDPVRPVAVRATLGTTVLAGNPTIHDPDLPLRLDFADDTGLDTNRPLKVTWQPEDQRFEPLTVAATSLTSDVWTGRFVIPPEGPDRDFDGQAVLTVQGATDRAGNVMRTTTFPFTINTGPFFDARAFHNPVHPRDLIFVVQAFPSARNRSAGETLRSTPVVMISQQGSQVTTTLSMKPILGTTAANSAFRGTFTANPRIIGFLDFTVTGTDQQGATSTRRFSLSVARLLAGIPATVVDLDRTFALSVPAQPKAPVPYLFVVGPEQVDPREAARDRGSELRLVKALPGIYPVDAGLAGPARLRVPLAASKSSGEGTTQAARVGIVRKTQGGRWAWLPAVHQDGALVCPVDRFGAFAVMRDDTPPVLGELSKDGEASTPTLEVPVTDRGSGVDPDGLAFVIDEEIHPAVHDEARAVMFLDVEERLSEGDHTVVARGADRAGNVAESAPQVLNVPPYSGIAEVAVYPNPARRSPMQIRYRLMGSPEAVRVKIYDTSGDLVRRLDGTTAPGTNDLPWDFEMDGVANGVYFYRLEAVGASGRKDRRKGKMVVLR